MTPLRLFALLLASTVFLAVAPGTALAEPPPDDMDLSDGDREAFMKRLRMMRMYALTEALELDEETAARLFPYLRTGDEAMEAVHRGMQQHRAALRALAKEEAPSDAAIDEHIQALSALEQQAAKHRADQVAGLKGILTAEQRLRFVLASGKIERELRRALRERRRGDDGERGRGDDGERRRR